MKRLIVIPLALLAACGGGERPEPGATRVIYQDVEREVQRPCPVTRPVRPRPLAKPLPADLGALVDLLTAKLAEWAGKGGYGERADAAIETCIGGEQD